MKKSTLVLLVFSLVLLFYSEPAMAHNCSGLQDCYQQSKLAALAAALIALLLSLLLDFSPIGYWKGLLEAITGRDILTGDKLAWWQRALNLVPGGKGARTAAKAVDEISDTAKAVNKVSDAAKVGEEIGDSAKAAGKVSDAAKTVDKASDVTSKFEPKIEKQLDKRGWTKETVQETIDNANNIKSTKDTRHLPDGSRMDDPATAYINKDGSYVVRNDRTGDIVQVSNRNAPNWKSPF
ncbi:colicin E5-related ribonuclease [Microcystis sp.]|uniref:colicin E5-related ribonuclease n=1 Tax=Microcystis sp. TaxID=1127 RepID=UPI00391885CD